MEEILWQILNELREIKEIMKSPTADNLPDILTQEHIRDYLHCGITKAYEIINSGNFTIIKQGREKGIPKVELLNWQEKEIKKKRLGLVR